jgi:hypothetical protein
MNSSPMYTKLYSNVQVFTNNWKDQLNGIENRTLSTDSIFCHRSDLDEHEVV